MADEDALMKAAKNKGRSASVCFSTTRIPGVNLVDTAAGHSSPGSASAASGSGSKQKSRRPASRSQSARITGAKAIRRRPPLFDYGDAPDSPHSLKGVDLSDPTKLYETGSGTSSPVSFRRKGSARRINSVHHSQAQRKSTPYLDIPKSPSNVAAMTNQEADENSYLVRSFSYTTKGLVNRGDSFRRRHTRSNSVHPSGTGGDGGGGGEEDDGTFPNEEQKEALEQLAHQRKDALLANTLDSSCANLSTYNVSVIGATGVGKTSLISQFMTSECINPYDRDRDGPSQQTVSIMLNGEESELCFHEIKSQKAFQKKHAFDAFLVIYSVVDKSTFQQAECELSRLMQDASLLNTRPAILVGNKIDLARSRSVSTQDGKCLACTFRVKYVEISVGINHNVDELLVGILQQIRLKRQNVAEQESGGGQQWYKSRGVLRASMKARQMFTWIFGREDSKFKNCENLHTL